MTTHWDPPRPTGQRRRRLLDALVLAALAFSVFGGVYGALEDTCDGALLLGTAFIMATAGRLARP